jgi:hypothetical protein
MSAELRGGKERKENDKIVTDEKMFARAAVLSLLLGYHCGLHGRQYLGRIS